MTATVSHLPTSSLGALAEHLAFVTSATDAEMRTMLVALATEKPDVLAELIDGIRLARLDRDQAALQRAMDEAGRR